MAGPIVSKVSHFFAFVSTHFIFSLIQDVIFRSLQCYFIVILTFIFLMNCADEHLVKYLSVLCVFSDICLAYSGTHTHSDKYMWNPKTSLESHSTLIFQNIQFFHWFGSFIWFCWPTNSRDLPVSIPLASSSSYTGDWI